MSIYAVINEAEPEFFASNQGWRDVTTWADELDADEFKEVVQLTEHGISEDLTALQGQLQTAIEQHSPSGDVTATLAELQSLIDGESGFILVNDGTGSNE